MNGTEAYNPFSDASPIQSIAERLGRTEDGIWRKHEELEFLLSEVGI